MKVIPLTRYLMKLPSSGAADAISRPLYVNIAAPSGPHHERELAEAFARGTHEGREAARREHDAELERRRKEEAVRLCEARREWVAGEADLLAAGLKQALLEIETQTAAAVAPLLEPILAEHARQVALAGLSGAIQALWEQDPAVTLRISGPVDLIDALRDRLDSTIAAQFTSAENGEVRVEAGRAVIQTALTPWIAQIRDAVQ